MPRTHRLLIAEDHRILREGLRALLSSHGNYEIVGEAANGLEAIKLASKLLPDLILIDLSMPKMDGLDAITEIRNNCLDTKILVLTVHKAEEYVFEALKSGADGYLLKDATHAELKIALENVLEGRPYLSPGISETLVNGYLQGKPPAAAKSAYDQLTKRERQILKLVAEGCKNKDISEYLCISIKTVEKHRANMMKKLDLHNASAITAFAIEKGLIVD